MNYACIFVFTKKIFIFIQSVFDQLPPEEMRKARTRANPFELIRGGMFLNRYNDDKLFIIAYYLQFLHIG